MQACVNKAKARHSIAFELNGLPKSDIIESDDYKGMYNNYISNMKKTVYSKIFRSWIKIEKLIVFLLRKLWRDLEFSRELDATVRQNLSGYIKNLSLVIPLLANIDYIKNLFNF